MPRYDFPTVHIGPKHIILNVVAAALFPTRYVRFRSSTGLLILTPTGSGASGAYKLFITDYGGLSFNMPPALMRLKLKPGDYKLYRAGNAFAIRRNERINEEAAE